MIQNYSGHLIARSSERKCKPFNERFRRDYFGVPDDRDPVSVILESPVTGEIESLKARESFTYILFPSFQITNDMSNGNSVQTNGYNGLKPSGSLDRLK